MASGLDPDEANVPWGKYSYNLEGLASGCYMEGLDPNPLPARLPSQGQRLRFRVELPTRCFVLSVGIKLPNAPKSVLHCLDDVGIERALNGDFNVVVDPASLKESPSTNNALTAESSLNKSASGPADNASNESPTSIDQTSNAHPPLPRKKFLLIRRCADSLRITITDIDDSSKSTALKHGESDSDASDGMDQRTLGIVVIGYTRGQTPAPSKLKVLLNVSAQLKPDNTSQIDRAEIDALLGLAFLSGRRYRQAAELLQRAAEINLAVAQADASGGIQEDDTLTWAAQLNLLSAYAYFEHSTKCNDGIIRLIQVAAAHGKPNPHQTPARDVCELSTDSLDFRTELLSMLENLINMLVRFLGDTTSPAGRMAAAHMIEDISEQLGCGMGPHMANILNMVLRSYPSCTTFGARDKAAAASFDYDSMEDCFERLTDMYCKILPLTEHTVLHRLYDNTLIPVFLDAFRESDYLHTEPDGEVVDDLMSTSVAQTLRVMYLSLMVLGADARIPTSVISRLLNILVLENGYSRTSLILRRTALHTWDAVTQALVQSASGNNVKAFEEHFKILTSYIPQLLVTKERPEFDYELEEEHEEEVKIFKEEELQPEKCPEKEKIERLLQKRKSRIEITDRHTLGRVISLLSTICKSLRDANTHDDDVVHSEVLFNLQECIGQAIADLVMSSLVDVSYHNAVFCGNGPDTENNLAFEFGHIDNQLNVVSEILDELFDCYWPCLSLLPSRMMEEAARTTPVRTLLGWCVFRMKSAAPPRGMIQLICACVKGLNNVLNVSMHGASKDDDNPSEVTFLSIYRTHLIWLPNTEYEETFELLDILSESVAGDLLANDLLLLIRGLGLQIDERRAQTEASLKAMSNIVAASAPRDPDLAIKSLQDLHLVHHATIQTERLSKAFPKSSRNGNSFNRRLSNYSQQSRQEPMVKSFYLHVVLSSCFDRFDGLARATQQRAGPSYMDEKIDAFVEHARFAVLCLHDCARSQQHRQYVGAILGDIFATCLAMEDHSDGRVRIAGFSIFAAALDVLFLAQKSTKLRSQQPSIPGGRASVISIPASPSVSQSMSMENINGVTDVSQSLQGDEDSGGANNQLSSGINSRSISVGDLKAVNSSSSDDSPRIVAVESEDVGDDEDEDDGDQKMMEIMSEGGSWRFHIENTSSDDLAFEEKAWQMLCLFISSSLGVERFADLTIQMAYLKYIQGCIMNALRGRSSGASVISFEHIKIIWDTVSRLVGSPWRSLNSRAMWVICAVVNVALYASIVRSNKGSGRQRSTQLTDFVTKHVFQRAESLLKSTSRESRIWGMRLLEVYVRSRDLNPNVVQVIPAAPNRVLRCLKTLNNDWEEGVRRCSKMLLEIHLSSLNRKPTSYNSSTVQTHFMSIKRHMIDEYDTYDSTKVELWFPPWPRELKEKEVRAYHMKLESFASTPIAGGEEVNLVKVAEDEMDDEGEDDDEGEEDDDEDDESSDVDGEITVEQPSQPDEVQNDGEDNVAVAINNTADDGGEVDDKSIADETVSEDEEDEDEDEAEEAEDEAVPEKSDSEDEPNRQDFDENMSMDTKATDMESPSSTTSTEAEGGSTGSEEDGLESPKDVPGDTTGNAGELDTEDVDSQFAPKTEDENGEEDDDYDHEFAPPNKPSKAKEDNEGSNSDIAPKSEEKEFEQDHDEVFEEDDEVINVTDVDDVLMDVSIPDRPKPERLNSFGLSISSDNNDGIDVLVDEPNSPSPKSPRGSQPSSNVNLNPDLDEGKKVLRRMGSFTGRAPKQITIEEGEAPRLERRRSVDVGSMSGTINKADLDEALQKNLHRASRKSFTKGLGASPKASDSNWRPRGPLDDSDEESAVATIRLPRRKSMKNVTLGASPDGKKTLDRSHGSTTFSTGDGDLQESAKHQHDATGTARIRSSRGFHDGSDDGGQLAVGPLATDDKHLAASTSSSSKDHNHRDSKGAGEASNSPSKSSSAGYRQGRRSLPRAKAFVKGGGPGLQRRNSGPSGRDEAEDITGTGGSHGAGSGAADGRSGDNNHPGIGSMSSPSLTTPNSSKGRLPRTKSQTGRGSLRLSSGAGPASADIVDGLERRPDRSHRYSRRETGPFPLNLDDRDEFEKDLLNQLEAKNVGEHVLSPGKSLTPTAGTAALMGRKSLLGDSSGSHGQGHGHGAAPIRSGTWKRRHAAAVAAAKRDAAEGASETAGDSGKREKDKDKDKDKDADVDKSSGGSDGAKKTKS